MLTHRFVRAAESDDPAQIAALLAKDVTFHAPVLTQDLHGKDLALRFLGEATRIIGNLTYTEETTDGERAFLFWKGIINPKFPPSRSVDAFDQVVELLIMAIT